MQTAAALKGLDPSLHIDQRVILHAVTWAQYESVLEARGDSGGVRIAYLEGELELMTPSRSHEGVKKTIARLLEVWAMEQSIVLEGFGSDPIEFGPLDTGLRPCSG